MKLPSTRVRRTLKLGSLAAATIFAFGVVSTLVAPLAGADTPTAPTSVFFLAVGASTSVGVQPSATDPKAHRTDHGYANYLVALEAAKGVTLSLTQIGCPGDSTTKVLVGDACYTPPVTQLTTAVDFLRAHFNDTGLVTIDLGFNNINDCLGGMTVDQACLSRQMPLMASELSVIISTLKSAAGPNVTFVGVNHYNPYVADSIRGAKGQLFATASVDVLSDFNASLKSIYDSFSIPLANVVAQFHVLNNDVVKVLSIGRVHGYVAQTCELTWMCRGSKLGPNIHPTDAGYQAIARAIDAVLPTTL